MVVNEWKNKPNKVNMFWWTQVHGQIIECHFLFVLNYLMNCYGSAKRSFT
jgi:hypothetical protein